MVTRAVRQLHALSFAALAIAVLAGGCAADPAMLARDQGIPADAVVRLSDRLAIAAHRTGSRVRVLAFRREPGGAWQDEVIATADEAGAVAAHLYTLGGETGEEWNSFLYGTAPHDSRRVVVAGFQAAGGLVTDGAWVLALRHRDLRPDQLEWSVLDHDGHIIASGTGIGP